MPSEPKQTPLRPTPFEPAGAKGDSEPGKGPGHKHPLWVWPTLGLLSVLVCAVLLWRPGGDATGDLAAADTQASPTDGQQASSPPPLPGRDTTPDESSPWADAQLARERKAAQDALQILLERQYELEEAAVSAWDKNRFEAARKTAAEGDQLYQSRQYVAAQTQYEHAAQALLEIQEALPAKAAEAREAVRQAIEAREPEIANAHLQLALSMGQAPKDLAQLQQRLALLPEVITAIQEARSAEQDGDLDRAVELLAEAATTDPQHQHLAAELARLRETRDEARFSRAMSEGYTALEQQRFETARKAFQAAGKLQPGTTEVNNALRELEVAATAQRLATLRERGREAEGNENWDAATKLYNEALSIDPSLVFAQQGLARTVPRDSLDKRLQAVLDDPQRLSDTSVAAATEALLAKALSIDGAGARLQAQIAQLKKALAIAQRPIPVTLRSDGQTSVTLYRVARLGNFTQQQLPLRPGTYTAVGSRPGYRDVRETFTVTPDRAPPPVTVICTETI